MEVRENKRYSIVITEGVNEESLTESEWAVISKVGDVEERGYTPQVSTIKRVQREVLKQNVSELDLAAVIKAINGID